MSRVLDIMIEKGILQRDELNRMVTAGQMAEPLHKVAIMTGLVSEEDFLEVASVEMKMPIISELPDNYNPMQFNLISPLFMEEHKFVPVQFADMGLTVAVNDPFDHLVADTLRKLYDVESVWFHLAREEQIRKWIGQYYTAPGDDAEEDADSDSEIVTLADQEDMEQLRDLASEAPVIKKVNQILTKAVERGASDVHIETLYDHIQVRLRIDGILHEIESLPKKMQQAISTRIKIMSKLDIAERRLPQDGRIYLKAAGKSIDLRVSCLPTTYGESVVMRILDRSAISFSLEKLGFPNKEYELFLELIHQPYGIILVTGPTGSGKTTTLYSALNTIHSAEKKIITIEDPVEYNLGGINQVQVNAKAGLTFARGLRSIVRQDPDVLLIGEIRDAETADIAIQSALTGHLVFSTLHTNDAAGAVTRLIEIGVEDYLLSSSLLGIMAQRLVRILCPECRKIYVPDTELQEKLRLPFLVTDEEPIYEPQGCPQCSHTGYRGRTAIFELLLITDEVKNLILKNKSALAIRDMGVAQGMTLLKQDGWDKVRTGQTSIAEVLRVAGHG